MKKALIRLLFSCALFASLAAAQTISNPTRHAWNEVLIRLNPDNPLPAGIEQVSVTRNGEEVASQVERLRDGRGQVWVAVTLAPGESATYVLGPGRNPPPRFMPRVREEEGFLLIANDLLQLRLPTRAQAGSVPAPIQGFRLTHGVWRGSGEWVSSPALQSFRAEVLSPGPLFGKVRLHYAFAEGTAEVDVTLPPGRPFALVESRHNLRAGDGWRFDLAQGWKPTQGILRRWFSDNFKGAPAEERFPLKPGFTRLGDRVIELLPRWTQSYDDGWSFGATDDSVYAGALVLRAGDWRWPHDNALGTRVRDAGDMAALELPTHRGANSWLLIAGPAALAAQVPAIVRDESFLHPDKLTHQYRLPFAPGEKDLIRGEDFYSNNTNPTGVMRQQNRTRVREALSGKTSSSLGTLYLAQAFFDPDWYGLYEHHWSPINPNFYTDFIRGGLALTIQLRGHPEFPHLRKLAEEAFRRDVDASVTLPGGAGQECPGYQDHAMSSWKELAPACAQHLGFDPRTWPRYQEGARFLAKTSPPAAAGKRNFHPAGDTHPGRPEPLGYAKSFGVDENPARWVSEEFPGFGVVLRNNSGTERETFLSFKAGPNRGHYHGDQLSIHFAANARPIAVDHHASYKPRPGQEHMHNRLSFTAGDFAYANMDGHERLIAFRSSPLADMAVGQVESSRLREVKALPPEDWDAAFPQIPFETALVYRRTLILLKGTVDIVVMLDEFSGPSVRAAWNLHVLGDRAERRGEWIEFDGLNVWLAPEAGETFEAFPWEHDNGGREKTTAARVFRSGTKGRFLSVLVPGKSKADVVATATGVKIGSAELVFGENGAVVLTLEGKTHELLNAADINLKRPQGDITLFVPDVGYPFGPLPEWLIEQRALKRP
jgi:hypothetical protein